MPRAPSKRLPLDGWTCEGVQDGKLLDPAATYCCDVCGTRIRWIHVLCHADEGRTVDTGGCCAARLCFDYDATAAEGEAKKRAARRQRFSDPRKWKPSRTNPANLVRTIRLPGRRRAVRLTVFRRHWDGQYSAALPDGTYSQAFATQAEAINCAFECVDSYPSYP